MREEPSVLLIDDMEVHAAYLRLMELEEEGWKVESAINETVGGALRIAKKKVQAYDGFTVVLLDIGWPHRPHGGIEILSGLCRARRKLPGRRVLIITRYSISGDEQIKKTADKLRMPLEMRSLQFETEASRDRLKRMLRRVRRECLGR